MPRSPRAGKGSLNETRRFSDFSACGHLASLLSRRPADSSRSRLAEGMRVPMHPRHHQRDVLQKFLVGLQLAAAHVG